jgi:hypothetical protein
VGTRIAPTPTKKGQKEFLPLHSDGLIRIFRNFPLLTSVEAHVLRVIRTVHNIPLDKVRLALDYISEQFSTQSSSGSETI